MQSKTIVLVVVNTILLIGLAGLLWLIIPPAYKPYTAVSSAQNTAVAGALADAGIKDAFVDVTPAQAYIAYDLPENTDPVTMQRFVLGAAGQESLDADKIVIVQYINGKPNLAWTVSTNDYVTFIKNDEPAANLEAKIEKKQF